MKKTGTEKERILSRSVSWKSTWSNIWASTRPRNVSEYLIQPDEPYKIYSPGDRVKGLVILNIERPTRITHLTICLHGVVQILKNGRTPGDSNQRWREYLSTGPSRCGEAYFGNGLAALFKDEVVLAGDGYLNVGSYRFQYDLELPSHGLPSSIEVSLAARADTIAHVFIVPTWPHILFPFRNPDKAGYHLSYLEVRPQACRQRVH